MGKHISFLAAVQEDGMALRYISQRDQIAHPEICMAAVRQNAAAIDYVASEVLRDHPEIIDAAIENPVFRPDDESNLRMVTRENGDTVFFRWPPEELMDLALMVEARRAAERQEQGPGMCM